jgi:hypothetical protein
VQRETSKEVEKTNLLYNRQIMSALSAMDESGIALGVANPIFPTSEFDLRKGAKFTFEVFEVDAAWLKKLVGKTMTYAYEQRLFAAELTELELCTSTVPALLLLRNKPTMRGVMSILQEIVIEDDKKKQS